MSDTPETDALGYIPTDLAPAWPIVEHSRLLERQRDAYAETLRQIATSAVCGNIVRERHPELTNVQVEQPRAEKYV